MKTFLIPVMWRECGYFIVKAKNMEDAILAVEENRNDNFCTGNANGEYLDGSFQVDTECAAELSEDELNKSYDDSRIFDS